MKRMLATASLAAVILVGCATSEQVPERVESGEVPPAVSPEPESQPRATPPADLPEDGSWVEMFDGSTLKGWEPINFGGEGETEIVDGAIRLNMGEPFTGIVWTNPVPRMNYEISLEAARLMGVDFFCGLTVPVRESHCTFIVGGWGGGIVGISSLDGLDASENETATMMPFEDKRWYAIRLRVTEEKIEGWIDDEKVVNVTLLDKKVGMRPGEIELCAPLGIASWTTTSGIRNIRIRAVKEPDSRPRPW